jgi:hypothetical protein
MFPPPGSTEPVLDFQFYHSTIGVGFFPNGVEKIKSAFTGSQRARVDGAKAKETFAFCGDLKRLIEGAGNGRAADAYGSLGNCLNTTWMVEHFINGAGGTFPVFDDNGALKSAIDACDSPRAAALKAAYASLENDSQVTPTTARRAYYSLCNIDNPVLKHVKTAATALRWAARQPGQARVDRSSAGVRRR